MSHNACIGKRCGSCAVRSAKRSSGYSTRPESSV